MIHFEEKQSFYSNSLIWAIIPGMIVPIIIGAFNTIKLGNSSFAFLAIIVTIELMVLVLLFSTRLETKLDEHGVSYRLFPFHLKTRFIAWNQISSAQVRKYNPLGEYWGWGIKGTRKNRAVNIAGDVGLQLELKNGCKLLIGTLLKEKMEVAVEKIKASNLIK
jgi:hypothetical protein